MTDSQKNVNEKTPTEIFLTKPLPPSRVKITESCDQVEKKIKQIEWHFKKDKKIEQIDCWHLGRSVLEPT